MVQSPMEKVSDKIIEFLDGMEFKRNHLARCKTVSRKCHQSVLSNVVAQVFLDDDERVDNFAKRDPLSRTDSAKFLVFPPHRFFIRLADPRSVLPVERKNPWAKFRFRKPPIGPRMLVAEHVIQGLLSERFSVSFYQLNQSCR